MKRTYLDFNDNIQSNWEEYDSSQLGYIQNKPFYSEYIDGGELTISADQWNYISYSNQRWRFETLGSQHLFMYEGKEYTVEIDGKKQSFICQKGRASGMDYMGIGDVETALYGEYDDFQFAAFSIYYEAYGLYILGVEIKAPAPTTDPDTGETIEPTPPQSFVLYNEKLNYVTIPKKYLPTDLTQQKDWSEQNASSSAFIKNRTHYYSPPMNKIETLIFDGDPTTGLEFLEIQAGAGYVKLSEDIPPKEGFIGQSLTIVEGVAEGTLEITEEDIQDQSSDSGNGVTGSGYIVLGCVMVVTEDLTSMGFTLSTGIWTICVPGALYVKEITYDCSTPGVLKQLDKMYLPEDVILPTVTELDNNKILSVQEGAWIASYPTELILKSSTQNSNKLFIITVDDTGTLTVSEKIS